MEINFLKWINTNWHGSNFLNHAFKYISYLGDFITIWGVLALVLLCFKKTRKQGLCLGMCLAGIAVFGYALKYIIDRARPFEKADELAVFIKSINMDLPDSASFPSGHTITSFASAMILTLCFGKKGAWSFILAGLIAFSRLFLCVHYPTDIIGGIILGIGGAIAFYFLFNFVWKKIEDKINKKRANKERKD
ncbi:MAG: phosphatase PAP2 family protein [Clostridia bacterium]|nr:phosphatase PAP2 family protein [Clostridia bacterium]